MSKAVKNTPRQNSMDVAPERWNGENVSSWEILNELRVHLKCLSIIQKYRISECCWRFLSPFYIFNAEESSWTLKLVEIPEIGS